MENEIITAPAAQVVQGDLKLLTTSLKVRTLMQPGFYSVEKLDPENPDEPGYQRLLNKARAKKLANYILDGQEKSDAFLPTSVFLATDKPIAHDREHNTISFRLEDVGPFSVVDGQHRLEGLRMAKEIAEKKPGRYPKALERILNFEVSVNIAVELPKIHQMCHFLIVNTTQKSVDKAVSQRIQARLTKSREVEEMPTLPNWINKIVEKGEVNKALKIVEYLNEEPSSPWFGKIRMANDEYPKGKTIKQDSFVKAIVSNVLTPANPLNALNDFETQKRIFLNYWKAIANILDDGSNSVLYKYNGVGVFCRFSGQFFIFNKAQPRTSYTVETMEYHLKQCFVNMETEGSEEYAAIGHPDWWQPGSRASSMNNAAINVVVSQMFQALNRSEMGEDIEL